MTETLLSELVAIIRQAPGDPGPLLRARWSSEPGAPSEQALAELARRALGFGATDEEIALSLGALFATSRAPANPP